MVAKVEFWNEPALVAEQRSTDIWKQLFVNTPNAPRPFSRARPSWPLPGCDQAVEDDRRQMKGFHEYATYQLLESREQQQRATHPQVQLLSTFLLLYYALYVLHVMTVL